MKIKRVSFCHTCLTTKDDYFFFINAVSSKLECFTCHYQNPKFPKISHEQKQSIDILRKVIKDAIKKRPNKYIATLGCSPEFFRDYLKSLWKPGMVWENYGLWVVDHIRPLKNFNLSNVTQWYEANNFKNLQPLWREENTLKGKREDKYYAIIY